MRGAKFLWIGLTYNYTLTMAILSQMCILPEGWDAPTMQTNEVGMSKKLAWKMTKRAEHDRMVARRERKRKREKQQTISLERDRKRMYQQLYVEPIGLERSGEIFYLGKGERSPKKAKNGASKEEAGTIGRTIVVKRFDGSRLTCVCKSLIY